MKQLSKKKKANNELFFYLYPNENCPTSPDNGPHTTYPPKPIPTTFPPSPMNCTTCRP